MTPTRASIENIVMRIQTAFLDAPTLTLLPADAARRFGLEPYVAEATLKAMAEIGVLLQRLDGIYVRRYPLPQSQVLRRGVAA